MSAVEIYDKASSSRFETEVGPQDQLADLERRLAGAEATIEDLVAIVLQSELRLGGRGR